MRRLIIAEFCVLFIGAAFAWANFIYELVNWLNKRACTFGCSAGLVNPFLTPCFYGALFFLTAFIISALLLKKSRK